MNIKLCLDCNLEKSVGLFYKKQSKCKECVKTRSKKYSLINKKKISKNKRKYYLEQQKSILDSKRNYYLNNTEKFTEKNASYYKENKVKLNNLNREYRKNRLKKDSMFKTISLLRTRLYTFLKRKGQYKNNKFINYIGCSKNELKIHLENQFTEGMTWENQGKWHIDHIIPLASAKSEEELYKLCHYTNLQPLWALDNIRKGDK